MLTDKQVISILEKAGICAYLKDYDSYDYAEEIRNAIPECSNVECGASKYCLFLSDYDYVIKWTFYEEEAEGELYDEALDEVVMYCKAKTAHLEQFFPETEELCTIGNVTFIKQRRIDYTQSNIPYTEVDSITDIGKEIEVSDFLELYNNLQTKELYNNISRTWGSAILALYGKVICKQLCDFIIENKINDLHHGNVGYLNKKPIILDFSGYHRSDNC